MKIQVLRGKKLLFETPAVAGVSFLPGSFGQDVTIRLISDDQLLPELVTATRLGQMGRPGQIFENPDNGGIFFDKRGPK